MTSDKLAALSRLVEIAEETFGKKTSKPATTNDDGRGGRKLVMERGSVCCLDLKDVFDRSAHCFSNCERRHEMERKRRLLRFHQHTHSRDRGMSR